jgi:hypothetical protein
MLNLKNSTNFVTLLIGTIVIVAVWVTSVNAQVQLTDNSKLALNGIGPIRVGMTVDEASQAAGVRLVKGYAGLDENFCSYFKPQGEPKGINFMVTKGRIVRVDISNERVSTIKGAKIGDTEEEIFSIYPGQIRVIKNPLGGPGNNLTFVPRDAADSNYRLIFRTNDRRVKYFWSGQLPQVEYIEGCS